MRKFFECVISEYFEDEYSIDFNKEDIFSDFSSTSRDDNNKISLVESDISCINFDIVKSFYIKKHNIIYKEKHNLENTNSKFIFLGDYASNDAIKNFDGMEYFIEFKNQSVINKSQVYAKIRDSLLIYLDIMDEKISYTKENLGYILVYNYEKSKDKKDPLQQHREFDKIQTEVMKYSRKKATKFGLKSNLEGFYFKHVLVLSSDEFKMKFNL